ncbi:hypothetical protein [Paenibacillus tuaregi]|uniref:hypothetical protein n=1 Tax=Paenibacillus tuaregi TaxID=1816681 RepID=UPI000B19B368|nr:hypothetical protein [Paenibacillus tuaregi]
MKLIRMNQVILLLLVLITLAVLAACSPEASKNAGTQAPQTASKEHETSQNSDPTQISKDQPEDNLNVQGQPDKLHASTQDQTQTSTPAETSSKAPAQKTKPAKSPRPSQAQSKTAYSLTDYEGSWIDTQYNLATTNDSENSVEIHSSSRNSGTIYFTLYNEGGRVTDSGAEIKIKNNKATFQFNDDVGKGTGTITLEPGQIKISLKLSSGEDELKQFFKTERTLVRNPYKDMTYLDPVALIREYTKNKKDTEPLTYRLDRSVEWNEELYATKELKVVVGLDKSGRVIARYSVNTLTGHIDDLSPTSEDSPEYSPLDSD